MQRFVRLGLPHDAEWRRGTDAPIMICGKPMPPLVDTTALVRRLHVEGEGGCHC